MKRFIQVLFTVIVILGMFVPGWAGGARDVQAAAAPLNQWPATPTQVATTGNPTAANFTVNAGNNRLLIVAIACYDSDGDTGQTFSATYGGTPLIQAVLQNSDRRQTWIGYLALGDSVSNTTQSLAVTETAAGAAHTNITVWAASYSGINQTTPITGTSSRYANQVGNPVQFSANTNVNANGYGLYIWSSNQTRSSDTESYTEHGEATVGMNSGVASKAFPSAGTTRPSVTFAANPRVSLSLVTLNPTVGNAAPTVNAGTDQLVAAEDLPANLDGTVTDDDFPGYPLITTWTQTSGPGTATFGDASAVDTTVTFDTVGVYVLQLTASDTQYSVSDDVTITYQLNTAPVVDAEPEDQSITGGRHGQPHRCDHGRWLAEDLQHTQQHLEPGQWTGHVHHRHADPQRSQRRGFHPQHLHQRLYNARRLHLQVNCR